MLRMRQAMDVSTLPMPACSQSRRMLAASRRHDRTWRAVDTLIRKGGITIRWCCEISPTAHPDPRWLK